MAAKSVFTALNAINSLKIMFAPFIPFSSEKLHSFLGFSTPIFGEQFQEVVRDTLGEHDVLKYRGVIGDQWKPVTLNAGTQLNQPAALFKKLDETLVDEERGRLGK